MGNWVNWLLVIIGIVCVIIELALGALTGFDLALIGGSLAAGGALGLLFHSDTVGLPRRRGSNDNSRQALGDRCFAQKVDS